MDRLLTMDKEAFLAEMAADVRRILSRVADAVNDAPTGHVINRSEMAVLAAMTELRERAFERAVQMRVDSTESAFSPRRPARRAKRCRARGGGRGRC